jgi:predicted nuclease of predicted toxin-antitoxin system
MQLPEPPRLHLNEYLSPRLAVELRRYGFDVTSSREVGLLSETDAEQFAYTALHKRAIVTFNVSDFAQLHEEYLAAEKEHWGIVFSTEETTGVLLHRLLRLLNSVSSEDLKNKIRWLNEFK